MFRNVHYQQWYGLFLITIPTDPQTIEKLYNPVFYKIDTWNTTFHEVWNHFINYSWRISWCSQSWRILRYPNPCKHVAQSTNILNLNCIASYQSNGRALLLSYIYQYRVCSPRAAALGRVATQIAKFMGPTWGPPGSCRPRWAPCWPHEPCYQGCISQVGWPPLVAYHSRHAIWRHRTRSTLSQVMAWCRQATSHYLNQCWLIICEVP